MTDRNPEYITKTLDDTDNAGRVASVMSEMSDEAANAFTPASGYHSPSMAGRVGEVTAVTSWVDVHRRVGDGSWGWSASVGTPAELQRLASPEVPVPEPELAQVTSDRFAAMLMIVGYSVIAVLTGIVSAEVAGSQHRDQSCKGCGSSSHTAAARFCDAHGYALA